VIFISMNKTHCDFCGANILKDDENQFWFMVDNFMRHYCGNCSSHGDNIQRIVSRKVKYYQSNNQYYEIEHIFKMIESLYRNNNGNMKISFRNDSQYNKDIIGLPIIKDNSPVGVIIDVDDREVKGVVWNRCMPIITEMYEGKVSSFEIVY